MFVRYVRVVTHTRVSPAIALTDLAGSQDRRRELRAGYQVHVAKPADASELRAAIGAPIGRTSQRIRSANIFADSRPAASAILVTAPLDASEE